MSITSFEGLSEALLTILDKVDDIQTNVDKLIESSNPKRAEQFLDMEEACAIIKHTKASIYKLCCLRKIPHYKQGKLLRFKESELLDWLAQGKKDMAEERTPMSIMEEMQAGMTKKPRAFVI